MRIRIMAAILALVSAASAEDDGVCAFDGNFVAAQNFHAAGWSAGD